MGGTVDRWTAAEEAIFARMAERGCGRREIAAAVDKGVNAVSWRLQRWREDRGLVVPPHIDNPTLRSDAVNAAEAAMLVTINKHGGFPVLNFRQEMRPDLPASVWLDWRGRKWVDGSAAATPTRAKPRAA